MAPAVLGYPWRSEWTKDAENVIKSFSNADENADEGMISSLSPKALRGGWVTGRGGVRRGRVGGAKDR